MLLVFFTLLIRLSPGPLAHPDNNSHTDATCNGLEEARDLLASIESLLQQARRLSQEQMAASTADYEHIQLLVIKLVSLWMSVGVPSSTAQTAFGKHS